MKYFRKSTLRTGKLITHQEADIKEKKKTSAKKSEGEEEQRPLKLILDGKTRWNSTFLMLKRALLLRPYINLVFVNSEDEGLNPDVSEWQAVEELVEVLAEFFHATELMSAEKYPTLAYVYPLFSRLIAFAKMKSDDACHEETQKLASAILKDLVERWSTTIQVEHLLACYLDPRFKGLNFLEEDVRKAVKALAMTKLAAVPEVKREPERPKSAKVRPKSDLLDSLFSNADVEREDETERYNSMPRAERDADVLQWWKANEPQLPRLGTFLLCSDPCSDSGTEIPQHREHLSPLRATLLASGAPGHEKQGAVVSGNSREDDVSQRKRRDPAQGWNQAASSLIIFK